MVLMIEATWTFEESAKIGKELRRQADRWVFVFWMVHERVRYYNITETRALERENPMQKGCSLQKGF